MWGQAMEMATAWFDNNPDPTWDPIVKALICIKKQAAAKKLADKTGVDYKAVLDQYNNGR